MPANTTGAMRKRQQIDQAGRMMFVWIAVASVVVGMAAVGSVFLTQKLLFNQKVISEKQKTVSTLRANIENVGELKQNIVALNSNQQLLKLVAKSDDRPLQVILDAMPATGNTPALGASIKDKITQGVDGLRLESIAMTPSQDELPQTTDDATAVSSSSDDEQSTASIPSSVRTIDFRLEFTGSLASFHEVLQRFERSIRTVTFTDFEFEGSDNPSELTLRVSGQAYYQPTRTLTLTDKEVRP